LLRNMVFEVGKVVCSCLDSGLASSLEPGLKLFARDVLGEFLAGIKQELDKLDELFVLVHFKAPFDDFSGLLADKEGTFKRPHISEE
ncbi:hypothetical protein KCU81_g121, partial [Aureobasidium melanogenum]